MAENSFDSIDEETIKRAWKYLAGIQFKDLSINDYGFKPGTIEEKLESLKPEPTEDELEVARLIDIERKGD